MIVLLLEHEFFSYAIRCMPPTAIIAPFGLHGLFLKELMKQENNYARNTKIITCPEQKTNLINCGFNAIAWKNIHAKLLIGSAGLLFGSWNFNLKHETKATQRELVLFITTDEPLYAILKQRFNDWFEYAGKWQ